MICCILPHETMEMVLQKICFNAVGVALLIAQGWQAIAQATLGWHMLCMEQRRRCCAFLD